MPTPAAEIGRLWASADSGVLQHTERAHTSVGILGKGIMPRIRPNGAARWANRTAAATQDYQQGVQSPRVSWQQATVAAADVHKAATTQALNEGRFAKGVAKAGDAKWQRNAAGKGADRFGPGAQAALPDYEAGFAPYAGVIESTPLPPRGPKGDPRNIQRVAALAAALHKKKTGSVSFALALAVGLASLLGLAVWASWAHWHAVDPSGGSYAGLLAPAKPGLHTAGCIVALVGLGAFFALGTSGAALDLVSATVTAAAAGGAAMAAVTGDVLSVRNCNPGVEPILLTHWVKSQTSGFYQIIHPSGHDQVRDIRGRHVAASVLPLQVPGWGEPLQPTEAITLTLGAGAVAGDVELLHMMIYYPDLPGINAKLIDLGTLDSRFAEYVYIEDSTTAAAASLYSGQRAINAASDLLIADTEYAILGAHIGAAAGVLAIQGADFGNLRIGIPAMNGRADYTTRWFPFLCEEFGLPLIPVINSNNKANVLITNVQDENLAAVPFALVLARLSS